MLGANDMQASDRFYSALLGQLGYEKQDDKGALVFSLPDGADHDNGPVTVYVKTPFDGKPATVGNGSMVAFRTRSNDMVRQVHAAAIAAGGTDEGPPGYRAEYSKTFFVAYVRDPLGNKIALFSREAARA